jgi:hypothetical protein
MSVCQHPPALLIPSLLVILSQAKNLTPPKANPVKDPDPSVLLRVKTQTILADPEFDNPKE